MLIPHTFIEDGHYYKPKGLLEFCYATSDVIELNGMNDFREVPPKIRDHAALRGSMVHAMIEGQETGHSRAVTGAEGLDSDLALKEATERMNGYLRFKQDHSIKTLQMEETMVYRHVGTEVLIGVTPDMYALVSCRCKALYCPLRGFEDALSAVEIKTQHKQYGEKQKQLRLKWFAQLQSQVEALEADDRFWAKIKRPTAIEKIVLHFHPDCGKVRGAAPSGFEVHRFPEDGQYLWDSMIRVAQAKMSHGYKLSRFQPQTQEVPAVIGNPAYEAPVDTIF